MKSEDQKREVEALQRELEQTRAAFSGAERRARTYLVEHGVLDQTNRGLSVLLREAAEKDDQTAAARASSST